MTFKAKAARTKALAVATLRANEGMANDVLDQVSDGYFNQGLNLEDALYAVQDSLVQRAIDRYSDKIRAALSRAGLELGDGPLSLESIKQAVILKTGLEIDDLNPESMMQAVDKIASARLSEATGVPIESVMSGQGLGEQIKAGIRASIDNGSAEKILMKGLSAAARAAVTWKRHGFDEAAKKKAMNAYYQKRYRRTHRMVWD